MIARQIGIVLCRVGAAVLTVQAIRSLGYTLPGLLYSPTGIDLARIGTARIGLYLVVTAVTHGLSMEAAYMARPDTGMENPSFSDEMAAQVFGQRVATIASIIIGLAMVLGRERIAVLLAKARHAGVDARG